MEKDPEHLFGKLSVQLRMLFQEIRTNKSLVVRFNSKEQYAILMDAGILKEIEGSFAIIYRYPNCLLISRACEEDLKSSIPILTLDEAIPISRKVIKTFNKLGITSGTGEFSQHLIKELICNSYYCGIDIPGQILELTKDSPRYFEIVNSLALTIPQLPIPLLTRYALYAHIYSLTYDDGASQTIFSSLQEFAQTHGKELLDLAVQHNNRLRGFVSNLILGMWSQSKDSAWTELEKLPRISYELEALNALANVNIENAEEAKKIAIHVKQTYPPQETTIPDLIWTYANIINATSTPALIQSDCISTLKTFGHTENERIHRSLVSMANHLKVSDEIKLEIIEAIDFGNTALTHPLFYLASKFRETSKFFSLVRNVVIAQGLRFDASEIRHYFVNANNVNPINFSEALVEMLTDKIGVIRFGGSRILQVIHPFDFRFDLLSLSAHNQTRLIRAIGGDILHPANVIRFIVLFRFTKHQQTLQTLVDVLAGIFEDYHYDAIIILRKELDITVDVDKELLDIFEKYHSDLAEIIKKKNSLEEFSPHKNQARAFEHFLRLSKNKMREKINQDQEKNPFFNSVRRVSISRGKSWKIENSQREPSPLQQFSSEITYPRMSLMNPDRYNWEILVSASTDYKNG